MKFVHDYLKHDDRLYRHIAPTPLDNPKLVAINQRLINKLGLATLDNHHWCDVISGRLSALAALSEHGLQPIAMAYAGHQFGQWAGQLGDGRGLLIAQLTDADGRLIDLHLKGAGRTPYSRHGDGRAMLASSIREYLGGHALTHLGIGSSDAIGLVVSDTPIYRQSVEQAAALLRVSDCHVRLGHLQWVAMYAPDCLIKFINLIAQSYYPELYDAATQTVDLAGLMAHIAKRTAKMIAQWQLIGFSHGVMNTDNLNITGTTLDFGPYGFMEGFNPTWINNHSDHHGRYCYQNQPMIGHWNLATAFKSLKHLTTQDDIDHALADYEQVLTDTYQNGLCHKLGFDGFGKFDQLADFNHLDNLGCLDNLDNNHTADAQAQATILDLGYRLLALMQTHRLDYTNTFRSLIAVLDDGDNPLCYAHEYRLLQTLMHALPHDAHEHWHAWAADYRTLIGQISNKDNAIAIISRINPVYILRNHMAQKAIEHADAGDFGEVARLFALLEQPYQTQSCATANDTRMALPDEADPVSCLS
ncbi:protein adenylyltransferase SelO family protein [Moraxella sp. ZJ142]|uniref:protein adenylyltransferase SelO family protein n=1 Tax=Moraxella marmotae TaxID=3344520 RepID=UPI0035D468EF